MHQAVLADVQVARARAAAPLVGPALGDIVLKGIDAGEAALFEVFHRVIDLAFFVIQRLQLPRAIVDDADGRAETQAQRPLARASQSAAIAFPDGADEVLLPMTRMRQGIAAQMSSLTVERYSSNTASARTSKPRSA